MVNRDNTVHGNREESKKQLDIKKNCQRLGTTRVAIMDGERDQRCCREPSMPDVCKVVNLYDIGCNTTYSTQVMLLS